MSQSAYLLSAPAEAWQDPSSSQCFTYTGRCVIIEDAHVPYQPHLLQPSVEWGHMVQVVNSTRQRLKDATTDLPKVRF